MSVLGGSQGRGWWSEGEASESCCVCSGKPGPGANVANAGMCAGKIIARVFDRVRMYHQKITARVRRVISAGSARAEAARGLNARRKAHHRSRAFERNATRDSRKLGLMPFEIAWPGHRISEASQECREGPFKKGVKS